jgi:hypothetical protein
MADNVSRASKFVPNPEMSAFGFLMGTLLVIVVLPLLPFAALVWLLGKLRSAGSGE